MSAFEKGVATCARKTTLAPVNDEPTSPTAPLSVASAPESPAENPAPTTTAIDGATAGRAGVSPEQLERLRRESGDAVEQHHAETKRKPGQRGPDTRQRKTPVRKKAVPVAFMGDAADQTPLGEDAPEDFASIVPPAQAFDRETAQAMVEIACGLLNDGASAIVRAVALKETGDKALANEAAKAVVMSEKIEKAVKLGAIQCAEKYAVRMEYAPETMLFGGLLIWAGQVTLSVRSLKAAGAELRAASIAPRRESKTAEPVAATEPE